MNSVYAAKLVYAQAKDIVFIRNVYHYALSRLCVLFKTEDRFQFSHDVHFRERKYPGMITS